MADEEVVLQPDLHRSDEVLNRVVVDVEAAFDQVPLQLLPLPEGIVEGLAQFAFGKVTSVFEQELLSEFLQVRPRLAGADQDSRLGLW